MVGRLIRNRRDRYGGSRLWIAYVAGLWLTLGLVMMWLRLNSILTEAGTATGQLADETGGGSSDDYVIVLLLFLLYLMTGVVAMTGGYRFGGPPQRFAQSIVTGAGGGGITLDARHRPTASEASRERLARVPGGGP